MKITSFCFMLVAAMPLCRETTGQNTQSRKACLGVTKLFEPTSSLMTLIGQSFGDEEVTRATEIARNTIKRIAQFDLSVFSYPQEYEDFIIKQGWETVQSLEDEKALESSFDRILTSFFVSTKGFKQNTIPKKMAEGALEVLNQDYSNFANDLAQGLKIANRTMANDAKAVIEKDVEILTYQGLRFCVYSVLREALKSVASRSLTSKSFKP